MGHNKNGGPTSGTAAGMNESKFGSGRSVAGCVADLIEGAFDEVFSLIAEAVIDGGHRLDHACSRTGKGELAVCHFALIEGKGTVAKHHEAAVGEFTCVVFVEIEDDFFVGKLVIADFHECVWLGYGIMGFLYSDE